MIVVVFIILFSNRLALNQKAAIVNLNINHKFNNIYFYKSKHYSTVPVAGYNNAATRNEACSP